MLGARSPVYLCLYWIQGTFRAETCCPICVSHDNNTSIIDKRSCGNLSQNSDVQFTAREQIIHIWMHLQQMAHCYSSWSGWLPLFSAASFHQQGSSTPMPPAWPALREEVVEAGISCFHCGYKLQSFSVVSETDSSNDLWSARCVSSVRNCGSAHLFVPFIPIKAGRQSARRKRLNDRHSTTVTSGNGNMLFSRHTWLRSPYGKNYEAVIFKCCDFKGSEGFWGFLSFEKYDL